MPRIKNLPHLAEQVFGVPQYATRQLMDSVKAVLIPRIQGVDGGTILALADDTPEREDTAPRQGGGVAVIPVHGILVPRRGQISRACTELTSYEKVRSQLQAALNDPAVYEVVLDINSGGGAVSGCKELADYIYASRNTKPITAIVNFNAFSAAYFIASACSKVVLSQTSGVGSIGVIMEHMEASRWEDQVGFTFTTLYRGDNKNNGSPHEPLSEQSRTFLQALINDAYETFTTSVAQYRGIDVQAVIDTQAGLYYGPRAINAGLADELSDPQTAINNIAAKYRPQPQQKSGIRLRAAAIDIQSKM
ncbi:S49 family peptidase [Enterobacter oligotrophicus]|uniref:S49 family peptidase n=1 Tax=Enterobacter oligotrophicus TaxID=2478464 RepID=UPI0023F36A62|nr:S49 family peptidase [Enterobacter oligotrophicus]